MNFLKNLIGGQIVKGYSISGDSTHGVGNHKSWKFYKAKKDSTGTQVTLFVLQKKSLKASQKQSIIKSAKKQISSLVKIRHPGVLAIVQPMAQDDNNITFVTQKIEGNLSTLIKQKKFQQFVSSQLELKLNLFPLLQTISFLHQTVKLCHLGINLDSIYITAQNKWKIAGMNYCQQLTGEENQKISQDSVFYDYLHLPREVVNEGRFDKFADSYSLGILFINFLALIKKTAGHNLMLTTQNKQQYAKNSQNYKQYSQFPCILQSNSPQQLIALLSQLFVQQSSYRLSISMLQTSKWINDPIVLTVKYLQRISNYQTKQQLQFLKGLSGVINKFSGKVLYKRILPSLTNLLKFNHLIASIIFILIDIIKKNMISVEDWRKMVWVQLKPITQGKQMTAQSLYLLISNIQILEKYLIEEQFMTCIIPLYLKCFDCPPKLKLLALNHVQRLSKKFDYQFTKTKLIPKLVNVMKDQKIDIRKDALKVLYSIVGRLDAQTIVGVILMGMDNCRKAGGGTSDPFVSAITVQIYNKITANMTAEILATKLMPAIMPYLTDPAIQSQQFGMYKNAILNMMNKIQEERKKTWGQNQQNNAMKPKYTEKDFILQKIDIQASKTQNNSESKFDFLNQYKNMQKRQQNKLPPAVNEKRTLDPPAINAPEATHQGMLDFGLSGSFQQVSNDENKSGMNANIAGQQNLNNVFTSTQNNVNQRKQNNQNSFNSNNNNNYNNNHNNYKFEDNFNFQDNFKIQDNFSHSKQNNRNKIVQKQQKINVTNNNPSVFFGQQFGSYQNQDIAAQFESKQKYPNHNQYNFGNQNKQVFGSSMSSEYKPPVFDFQENTDFSKNSSSNDKQQFKNITPITTVKQEKKQQPFSPSTQESSQPAFKQTIKQTDSPTKKLVGPAQLSQGGLKKPPKFNEFNVHLKQQAQQKPSNPTNPTISSNIGNNNTKTPTTTSKNTNQLASNQNKSISQPNTNSQNNPALKQDHVNNLNIKKSNDFSFDSPLTSTFNQSLSFTQQNQSGFSTASINTFMPGTSNASNIPKPPKNPDDPFADVQQEYGITTGNTNAPIFGNTSGGSTYDAFGINTNPTNNINNTNNLNNASPKLYNNANDFDFGSFGQNNLQSNPITQPQHNNKNKSNDPFDDLF